MTTTATEKAFEAHEAQEVIVVVLAPSGAGRPGAGDPGIAQIYRLPCEGLEEYGQITLASGLASSSLPIEILAQLIRVLEQPTTGGRHEPIRRPTPCAQSPQLSSLTQREREVLQLVLDGLHNKNIANTLGISMRTVENHRAAIMRKTGSKSLPALVRLAIAAEADDEPTPTAGPARAAAPRVRQGPDDRQDFVTL